MSTSPQEHPKKYCKPRNWRRQHLGHTNFLRRSAVSLAFSSSSSSTSDALYSYSRTMNLQVKNEPIRRPHGERYFFSRAACLKSSAIFRNKVTVKSPYSESSATRLMTSQTKAKKTRLKLTSTSAEQHILSTAHKRCPIRCTYI